MREFFKSSLFFKMIVVPLLIMVTIASGILIYLNSFADELVNKKASEYANNVLKSYITFSKSSIEKGQRHSFQEVIEGLKTIDGVKDVFANSRDGLMMYKIGEKSVGLPFVRKDGKFFNPNLKYFDQTNGLWMRNDWFYKNIKDSKITECMYKKIHPKDRNCGRCHYELPKNLKFNKKRIAFKKDGNYITAYYNLPVD